MYQVTTTDGTHSSHETLAEAMTEPNGDFIRGPVEANTPKRKIEAFRTNWEMVGGRWEGFVSIVKMAK